MRKPKNVPPGADLAQCSASQCGAWIFWIEIPDGNGKPTRIPLDTVRSRSYQFTQGPVEPGSLDVWTWSGETLGYHSHFLTCPARAQFSGRNPK